MINISLAFVIVAVLPRLFVAAHLKNTCTKKSVENIFIQTNVYNTILRMIQIQMIEANHDVKQRYFYPSGTHIVGCAAASYDVTCYTLANSRNFIVPSHSNTQELLLE